MSSSSLISLIFSSIIVLYRDKFLLYVIPNDLSHQKEISDLYLMLFFFSSHD